nr:MAG: capsid protein [Cressdnaviricota sp.]
MVFRKKYVRKTSKKRSYRKKKLPQKKNLDREIMRVINKQKQIKSQVYTYTNQGIPSGGLIYSMLDIPAQGVTAYTNESSLPGNPGRIGNTFYIKSLEMYFNLTCGAFPVAGDIYNNVRVVAFQWLVDSSTETPNVNDILMDLVSSVSYLSPINFQTSRARKFKVLVDKHYTLVADANTASITRRWRFTRGFIKRLQTTTDADSGTAGNIIKGKLFVLLISDQSANYPAWNASFRLNFTD